MSRYCRSHLDDQALKHSLRTGAGGERAATADFLADIAEFDARRLFLPAGYDSMYAYCLRELHLSEEAACKRIRVARAARQFPMVFGMLAEGRLHLSGMVVLAPHLRPENVEALLAAAVHKTRAEIEQLVAEHFPRADLATRVEPVSLAPQPSPGTVGTSPCGDVRELLPSPGTVAAAAPWPKVAPLSAERYALQMTIGQGTHDKLRYAQALLGHAVPSGDLGEVLDRALDALVAQLEKQKFGATSRPRPGRTSEDPRHIPAAVKRAVWERDGAQCSFVGEGGHRCGSRMRLEFDHVDPVARGGEATVEGIRLRCRAHNQYEADCVFGGGFMASKREAARLAAAEARVRSAAARAAAAEERVRAASEKREKAAAEAQAAAAERDPDRSVVPWLMQLGYHRNEAREAAALCENMSEAPMEQRIKAALRHFHARTASRAGNGLGTAA